MRAQILLAAAFTALLLFPFRVAGQEVGAAVTLTGCLAQEEDEGGIEYLLEHVAADATSATEIELIPAEGVSLAPHVGHTVEVTGVVVADEDEAGEVEEADPSEPEDDDAHELHIRVTALEHRSATCEGG